MIPYGEDPPWDSDDIIMEVWACEGCGAFSANSAKGEYRLEPCSCDGPQSGSLVGWLTKQCSDLFVWDEKVSSCFR